MFETCTYISFLLFRAALSKKKVVLIDFTINNYSSGILQLYKNLLFVVYKVLQCHNVLILRLGMFKSTIIVVWSLTKTVRSEERRLQNVWWKTLMPLMQGYFWDNHNFWAHHLDFPQRHEQWPYINILCWNPNILINANESHWWLAFCRNTNAYNVITEHLFI